MARSPYGDPDAIEAVARRCDHEANRLDDAAHRWVGRIARTRWECARADRTRREIDGFSRGLHRDAHELRRLGAELRQHAQHVRDQIRAQQRAENDVQRWLQRPKPPGFVPPVFRRPAPGAPEWIALRDRFRRQYGGL